MEAMNKSLATGEVVRLSARARVGVPARASSMPAGVGVRYRPLGGMVDTPGGGMSAPLPVRLVVPEALAACRSRLCVLAVALK